MFPTSVQKQTHFNNVWYEQQFAVAVRGKHQLNQNDNIQCLVLEHGTAYQGRKTIM
jgi:hypothetical protein